MAEKENTIKKDTWLYFEDNQGKHFKAFNFADYLMDRFHFTFTFLIRTAFGGILLLSNGKVKRIHV